MTERSEFVFRHAGLTDLPLLAGWLRAPHVARWWGDDATIDAGDLADPRVDLRIAEHAGRPLGMIQDYDVRGWEDHPLWALGAGARGIDFFIGPATMLGRGLGRAMIAARVAELFAAGAPAVGSDPHPDNARSLHVCARVGLTAIGPARDGPWGRYVPMRLLAPGKAG